VKFRLGIFLLYILLPLCIWFVFTYPLVFRFFNSIYSDFFGDSLGKISVFYEIGTGSYDFRLGDLLAPLSLVFRELARLLPPVSAYNFSILAAFLGTFYAGFYLLRTLGFSKSLSLFFATSVMLAPIRLWYSFEWPEYAQWGFILIYLSLLFKFLKSYKTAGAILAGLVFSVVLGENPYHGFTLFFLTLVSVLFTMVYRWKSRSGLARRHFFALLIFAAAALVFSLPSFYRFLSPGVERFTSPDESVATSAARSIEDLFTFSARPWHYLIPDINHPVFGNFALGTHRWIWSRPPYYLTERFFPKEHTLYLGLTLLLLSLYAFRELLSKRSAISSEERFFILLLWFLVISMMVFSFPPYIVLKGIRLYFPSYFIYRIISQVRAYSRFGALVFICNAVLACFGLRTLLKSYARGYRKILIFSILLLLMIFEFINFPPFHNISTELPQAYRWLSEQKEDFAYLEYPTRIHYTDRLYQFIHQKEILNPYHQTPEEVEDLLDSIDSPDFSTQFKALGGRYIFFHRPEEKSERQKVSESWGYPAWGTHDVEARRKAEKPPLKEEYFLRNPNFREVKDFGDVVIFEVN